MRNIYIKNSPYHIIAYPVINKYIITGYPILVWSTYHIEDKQERIYFVCIWSDGTILWSPLLLDVCQRKNCDQTLSEIDMGYRIGKVSKQHLNQFIFTQNMKPRVRKFVVYFGTLTLYDFYYYNEMDNDFDFITLSFFSDDDVAKILIASEPVATIYKETNSILHQVLSMIPNENVSIIEKDDVQTVMDHICTKTLWTE
jgi:hypothetical protein